MFVTGMLRSGTTLIQALLTSHRQLLVAHQPFFQFYVDVKDSFLQEHGMHRILPLGDGMDGGADERGRFKKWLDARRFDVAETRRLASRATTGKGGGERELIDPVTVSPGTFHDIRAQLHALLADRFERLACQFIGAKEVLCEEYVPALLDHSDRCLLIVRDPRAVIASASYGRYRESVGDRYPLLMLIRLWRKSAAYWLAFRNHRRVHAVRYEDLVERPDDVLRGIALWLGVEPFPDELVRQPLRDVAGAIWRGNSSFGDKMRVDPHSSAVWKTLLAPDQVRFIEACTRPELTALGYPCRDDLEPADISGFVEDLTDVRKPYLALYHLDRQNRELELQRWERAQCGQYHPVEGKTLFLFPDTLSRCAS